jgi:hypothetical protein
MATPDRSRSSAGIGARTLDGRPAAAATARRKRAVFHSALGYAVELGLLPANPAGKIQRKPAPAAETVDRRVVASPARQPCGPSILDRPSTRTVACSMPRRPGYVRTAPGFHGDRVSAGAAGR